MPACADGAATLHKPVYLGLHQWPASIVLRLPFPKFSHIKLNTKLMTIHYFYSCWLFIQVLFFIYVKDIPMVAKVDT